MNKLYNLMALVPDIESEYTRLQYLLRKDMDPDTTQIEWDDMIKFVADDIGVSESCIRELLGGDV